MSKTEIFKLDLDTKLIDEKGWKDAWVKTRKNILKELGFKLENVIIQKSSSRGYHVWIHAKPIKKKNITEEERVKIQWLLGDDESRAWLCLQRCRAGVVTYNKLFSKVFFRKKPPKRCLECGLRRRVLELLGENKEERKF